MLDTPSVADVEELYRRLSDRLLRTVRGGVRAPEPVIEDACQFAWSRLLRHRDRVERAAALSWLTATAMHEAVKLVRRACREPSLETMLEQGGEMPWLRPVRTPDSLAEDHERLRALTTLSRRHQQALWLYGLGLSYEEIARRQGSTPRAVERQLHRARAALRRREGVVDLGR